MITPCRMKNISLSSGNAGDVHLPVKPRWNQKAWNSRNGDKEEFVKHYKETKWSMWLGNKQCFKSSIERVFWYLNVVKKLHSGSELEPDRWNMFPTLFWSHWSTLLSMPGVVERTGKTKAERKIRISTGTKQKHMTLNMSFLLMKPKCLCACNTHQQHPHPARQQTAEKKCT